MYIIDTSLDKISRVTKNPDIWHSAKRLWRFMLKQLYSIGIYNIPESPVLNNFDGKASLHLRTGEFSTRRLWFLSYVQYDEQYFLRKFVKRGMTIIDVGANIGAISITCGLRVRPFGSVYCFEPISSTFEFLKENIRKNELEQTIIANQLVVSNKTGDIVKLAYTDQHSDCSHLSIGLSGKDRDPKGYKITYESVKTITLDYYVASKNIQRVDFLKIDVEGAELMVIEGAQKLIERDKPTILCEFNNSALKKLSSSSNQLWDKWLSHGYSFFNYNHRKKTLTLCRTAPQEGAPTYVGTTNPQWLAEHIGAKIV